MYITSMNAQQTGQEQKGYCDVLVAWQYGATIPEAIQIHVNVTGNNGPSQVLATLDVKAAKKPISLKAKFTAPGFFTVSVCPRLLEGTKFRDKMGDENGELQDWQAFCLQQQLNTTRQEGQVAKSCAKVPQITHTEILEGAIRVHWNNPDDFDEYTLWWGEGNKTDHKVTTEDQQFLLEKTRDKYTYTFRVQGEKGGFLWLEPCRSELSAPVSVYVPEGFGYLLPKFAATTTLAALARDQDHMEVFAIGGDGCLHGNWWDGQWHMWYRFANPIFTPKTPVAALSRDTGYMDLFAVALDGHVHVAWWHGNPWYEWTPIGNAVFPPNTPLGVLSRHSDFMDIFAVGMDGQVWSAWWNGNPWRDWQPIAGQTFPANTPIATLSRHDDFMDIFAVGDDGQVWHAWWNGNPWAWRPIAGQLFSAQTPIAALSRHDDHMEIFAVGQDGIVCGNEWDGNWHDWYRLEGLAFDQNTPIASVSRDEGHMEVFAVGLDQKVYGNVWLGGWQVWFSVESHPQEGYPPFFPSIAALSRDSDIMDVFVISRQLDEEFVMSNWFHQKWHKWFIIP